MRLGRIASPDGVAFVSVEGDGADAVCKEIAEHPFGNPNFTDKAPAEVVAKINDPAYQNGIIPANTYEGQTTDAHTVAIRNVLVTRVGVPTDTVYKMTKALFENLPALQAAHAAAKGISLQKAGKNPPVPLHPGAAKYYKEKGAL